MITRPPAGPEPAAAKLWAAIERLSPAYPLIGGRSANAWTSTAEAAEAICSAAPRTAGAKRSSTPGDP